MTVVAAGFTKPILVADPGDGSRRLFVVEKPGRIRIIADGVVLPQPFLDIQPLVTSTGIEQGLVGLAFHPAYVTNGSFFVAYASGGGRFLTIERFRVSNNPDLADPQSRSPVLTIPHPTYRIHYGGMLAFGPDGYLYLSTGDGGSPNDINNNAQQLTTLLGKVLRLDVNAGTPYSIPPSNPFVGKQNARPEIWAYGLRNPWRMSFDRATGDLYIGDVGQNAFEEVNVQTAGSPGGQNYGWRIMEAFQCFDPKPCLDTGFTPPVYAYPHDDGNCAVIGGYVYRGSRLPALQGAYVFGDYCTGRIWQMRKASKGWTATLLTETGLQVGGFGQDQDGEIYLTDLANGVVYRLDTGPALTPSPTMVSTTPPSSTATATATRTPTASSTATSTTTLTATSTSTPTRSPTPTATKGGAIGGAAFTLRSNPTSLSWDDGSTETGYFILRWSPVSGAVLLPSSGTALGEAATGYVDPDVLPDDAYCYNLITVAGEPPSLDQVVRQSDLLCVIPRTAAGTSPGQTRITTKPGGLTELHWIAPGTQDGYAVIRVTFDGLPPQSIALSGDSLSAQDNSAGQPACYFVIALKGSTPIGNSDGLCSVTGGANGNGAAWYTTRALSVPPVGVN